jgi:hypothetical protein
VSDNRKIIPVPFNLDDPQEKEMYEYLKNQVENASGHIKRLVFFDMMLNRVQDAKSAATGSIRFVPAEPEPPQQKKEEDLGFDENDLGGICD